MTRSTTGSETKNSTNVLFKAPPPLRLGLAVLSRLAPPLAVRVAADLFCRAPRARRRPAETRLLQDATPFTFSAEGHDLAAWSWGSGPMVLLHHGWSGRGSQLGAFVSPLVAAGYQVVTYDAPAHGDSPGRVTNGFQMGRICRQFVDQQGGIHAVIGHSLGCSASGFAMRFGAHIERAVFLNPPAEMDTYAEMFRLALGLTPQVLAGMKAQFEKDYPLKWRDFEPANMAHGQTSKLLVVADRDDRKAPWLGGRAIAEAWPDGRFHLTEGLGHSRIVADPGVVERVVEFVAAAPTENERAAVPPARVAGQD